MAYWNDPSNQGEVGNFREGYYNYLQDQGYTGQMGPDMRAYAQTLRAQGRHPWMDYFRSQGGLGGLMGGMGIGQGQPQWSNPQQPRPNMGSGYQQSPGPRPVNPGGLPQMGQGIAVGEPNGGFGLAGLTDPMRLAPRKQRNPG